VLYNLPLLPVHSAWRPHRTPFSEHPLAYDKDEKIACRALIFATRGRTVLGCCCGGVVRGATFTVAPYVHACKAKRANCAPTPCSLLPENKKSRPRAASLFSWRQWCLSNSPMRKPWLAGITHVLTHVVHLAIAHSDTLLPGTVTGHKNYFFI
jgi:hypothetical protein